MRTIGSMSDLKPLPVLDQSESMVTRPMGSARTSDPLPDPGDIIEVRQNITSIRARVTDVHTDRSDPQVAAVEVDA